MRKVLQRVVDSLRAIWRSRAREDCEDSKKERILDGYDIDNEYPGGHKPWKKKK